jgi:hypothetical protein
VQEVYINDRELTRRNATHLYATRRQDHMILRPEIANENDVLMGSAIALELDHAVIVRTRLRFRVVRHGNAAVMHELLSLPVVATKMSSARTADDTRNRQRAARCAFIGVSRHQI